MDNIRYVSYTDSEIETVKKGISAIKEVLLGNDSEKKQSLLLCLDWYMDPYYGQDISDIEDELIDLLQTFIISEKNIDIAEDALELLNSYTSGPYRILEDNINKIDSIFMPNIMYTINRHRIENIEQLMVAECGKIYEDAKKECNDISNKVWLLHNSGLTEKTEYQTSIEMAWLLLYDEIHTGVQYKKKDMWVNEKGMYIEPEMHFNIILDEKRAILAYFFGKRFSRCIEYDLLCDNDMFSIDNKRVLWVG
ncbi:MAG: hypothetical protein J6A37_17270 [Oscillospiraceae bacterium]|nr:hypothetical protein [Oscillospiraceae bacterium]